MNKGTLTFFCGKMGSGKSTKAREIAQKNNAVLLSEDECAYFGESDRSFRFYPITFSSSFSSLPVLP